MARPSIIELTPRSLEDREVVARVFRVLGDTTRLRILELLAAGPYTQSALVDELGGRQSRISEHLSCLVWCGFVEAEREGRSVRYRIADQSVLRTLNWARAFMERSEARIAACRRVQ
jgi:DNA-binding transcriptional ArsR family regulator